METTGRLCGCLGKLEGVIHKQTLRAFLLAGRGDGNILKLD
jgi:hypothetical protein